MNTKNARQIRRCVTLCTAAAVSLYWTFAAGCGSNSSVSESRAFVTIVPGNMTVNTGSTLFVLAAASPTGVTWALSGTGCSGAGCGTLTGATGTSVTYVAPISISGAALNPILTATSIAEPSVNAAVTLTVTPVSVTITPPASTVVDPGASIGLTATVTNDVNNDGVSWSLSGTGCSGSACGTLSKATTTSATYTAPQTSTSLAVSVTATSIAAPGESTSVTLSVPVVSKVITFAPAVLQPAIAGQAYSATVQFSGGEQPYTFSEANLPSWATVSSTGNSLTFAGTPAAADTGTANVQVTVTDSSTPTPLIGSAYIALTTYTSAATGNSLLNGSYTFYGLGWEDGSAIASTERMGYIGSFTADGNGNITGGELDLNDPTGVTSYASLVGTYSVQANQTGVITLLPSGAKPAAPITLVVGLGGLNSSNVATDGQFVEYDDSTGIGGKPSVNSSGIRISGPLARQTAAALSTSSSPLSGSYAFGMAGYNPPSAVTTTCESADSCGAISLAGALTLGSGGAISTGEEDVTISEKTQSQVALSGALGNVGNTDASGRMTATLNASNSSLLDWPVDYVIYVVNPQTFYAMSVDSYATTTLVSGEAMQQNLTDIAATPFSASEPIVMYSNVLSTTALKTPNGQIRAELQLLTVVPTSATAGSISGQQFVNASGSYSSGTVGSTTYTVQSNGRVTQSGGSPEMYLVDTSEGFATTNGNPAGLFQFQPQTSTSLNAGNYVLSIFDPDSQIAPLETGIVTVPSGGVAAAASGVALTGEAYGSFSSQGDDQSNSAGTLLFDYQALTGAVSNASGVLGNITLSGGIQACAGGGGYVISPASFACVEGAGTSSFSEILLFEQ